MKRLLIGTTLVLFVAACLSAAVAQDSPPRGDRPPPPRADRPPPPPGQAQALDDAFPPPPPPGGRPGEPPPRGKGPKGPPHFQPGDGPPPHPPGGPHGGPGPFGPHDPTRPPHFLPPGIGHGPPPFDLQQLERDDPEMYALMMEDQKLDRETQELAQKYRQAKAEDREKLKTELGVKVNQHFDSRQKRRELSLKRMEEELARLREAIQARNETRDEVIKKRLGELIGPAPDLDF